MTDGKMRTYLGSASSMRGNLNVNGVVTLRLPCTVGALVYLCLMFKFSSHFVALFDIVFLIKLNNTCK